MHDNDNYTNYDLRSNISPPQNPALSSFENDIYNMERNIEFRKFLTTSKINSKKTYAKYAPLAKSTNLYEMSDTDYNRFLGVT